MERLTIQYEDDWVPKEMCNIDRYGGADDCGICSDYCTDRCEYCPVQKCFDKLAAYEDTGLTPERCAELAKAEQEGRLTITNYHIGVDTANGSDYTGFLNPFGKYVTTYAKNHNISIDEAYEAPMVKARREYYDKTGK